MAATRLPRPSPVRFALWLFLGFAILVFDQVTKFYFEHNFLPGDSLPVFQGFNLVLAHNTGAAFSFLADAGGWQRWGFTGIALVVVVAMLVLLWRHNNQKLFSLALTLIAAGAFGNMIDRAVYGFVIDFLDFYWQGWHWPAFNIADIAICAGAAGLVLDEILGVQKRK